MINKILKSAVVSEKSSQLLEGNKFTFLVTKEATKIDIKNYFKQIFQIDVEKVNIVNVKPKKRRRGKVEGLTAPKRKAIVSVKDAGNLEKIKELF